MGLLELVLDKVRQSDLAQFRNKVETMKAPHEQYRQELGIDGIDDIIKSKEIGVENRVLEVFLVSVYDNEAQQEVTQPINQSDKDMTGTEIFDKFLQSIKG